MLLNIRQKASVVFERKKIKHNRSGWVYILYLFTPFLIIKAEQINICLTKSFYYVKT